MLTDKGDELSRAVMPWSERDGGGGGSAPKPPVCACLIAPMAKPLAPSEPELAKVTMPKGALFAVVPGVVLHKLRHSLTRAAIKQE